LKESNGDESFVAAEDAVQGNVDDNCTGGKMTPFCRLVKIRS
jgi:hypothetical protein